MLLIVKRFATLGIACGLGSLAGISVATAANTVSALVPFTTSPVSSNGQQTGWTFTGSIPQFTTGLQGINPDCSTGNTCVLTGISLTVTDVASGSVTFTAPNNPNGSLSHYSIGSEIDYLDPFGSGFQQSAASYHICDSNNVSLTSTPTPSCNGGLERINFQTGQNIQAVLKNSAIASSTTASTSASILNAVSSGPVSIMNGTTQSYVSGNDSNNVSSVPDVTAFVSAQATYTYSDTVGPSSGVPEPASLAVFAFGLLGISSARLWISRR